MHEPSVDTELSRRIEGEVTCEPTALAAMSRDYGGVYTKTPGWIARPRGRDEAALAVRWAYERGLPISARANGFSFGGQALNQGGLVIDTRGLNRIGPLADDGLAIEVEAGVLWQDLVTATLQHGRLPPVLTSYLRTSVGGTLSAAGFGMSSFRHGTQVDNCLELEVVDFRGEIVRCSAEEHRDLFEHALCGFGQFGVIVAARLRLRPAQTRVRTYFLQYDDLDAHLADQATLVDQRRVHFIDAMMRPCFHGMRSRNGKRERFHSYLYPLNATVESDDPDSLDDRQLLAGLHFSKWIYAEDVSLSDFLLLGHTGEEGTGAGVAKIFNDVLLPASAVPGFLAKVQAHLLPRMAHVEHTLLWPMLPELIDRPLLKLPRGERLVFGIGLYSRVQSGLAKPTMAIAQSYVDLALSLGGTYFLSGSVRLDAERYGRQFGPAWASVAGAKRRHDPRGLFNPGFFRWTDS